MWQLVEDLGTHVRWSAAVGVDLLLLIELEGEGEVDQLYFSFLVDEHVLGFEVSVCDACIMAVADGLHESPHVVLGFFLRQLAFALAQLRHVLSVEVLQYQVSLGEPNLRSK